MLVIINCILALIFFFVFFIMLHSEPSRYKRYKWKGCERNVGTRLMVFSFNKYRKNHNLQKGHH